MLFTLAAIVIVQLTLTSTTSAALVEYIDDYTFREGVNYTLHMVFDDDSDIYYGSDAPPPSSAITRSLVTNFTGDSYWLERNGETIYSRNRGAGLHFWSSQEPYGERTLSPMTELYPYFPSKLDLPEGEAAVVLDENGDVLDRETWIESQFTLPTSMVYAGSGIDIERGIHLWSAPIPLSVVIWLFGFGLVGVMNLVIRRRKRQFLTSYQ
jgi:hypothetical protein